MKHPRLFQLCLLQVCAAILALHTTAGAAAGEDAQLKKSTQALQELRGRIEALDHELARDRGRRDELMQQIEATENRLQELNQKLRGSRSQTEKQATELRQTRAERAALSQKLNEQKGLLGRQIRAAYLIGRSGTAKLLLRQDDTGRVERLLTWYDYLNRARAGVIGGIKRQEADLRELEQRQEQQTTALSSAQAAQEQLATQLAATKAQRLEAVQKLKSRIAGGEGELEQLRAGSRELEMLISRLRELLDGTPAGFHTDQPLGRQKGHMPWPLRGKLLARFGAAKAGGKLKWTGLWIAAAEGTPVRAVANGRVAYVGQMQRYGLIAVVEHGDGYFTLYGHNAEVAKNVGDPVRAGEVLAKAGSSGGYDQAGLYFELRKGAVLVNPLEWLVR